MLQRRPFTLAFAVTTAALAAALWSCSIPTGSSTQRINQPYAVIYGTVTTGNNATSVLISGQAYPDSASALNRDSVAGGFNSIVVAANGTYITSVSANAPRKVFFNIEALNSRPSAADTVFAVRVQLDSLGGTPPHDSVAVNFTFP
jgi:hypothetical protein